MFKIWAKEITYKLVEIWPGLFVCKQVTVCPGHIWTTLYLQLRLYSNIQEVGRDWSFCNMISFLRWGVVSTSPSTKTGGPPLVGCPRMLIQYIRSYPPYLEAFLHPQPEDDLVESIYFNCVLMLLLLFFAFRVLTSRVAQLKTGNFWVVPLLHSVSDIVLSVISLIMLRSLRSGFRNRAVARTFIHNFEMRSGD
jgi:hypothetical protein